MSMAMYGIVTEPLKNRSMVSINLLLNFQRDELRRNFEIVQREKSAFQHQCTSVIQDLNQTNYDYRKLKATYDQIKNEHDSCSKVCLLELRDRSESHLDL